MEPCVASNAAVGMFGGASGSVSMDVDALHVHADSELSVNYPFADVHWGQTDESNSFDFSRRGGRLHDHEETFSMRDTGRSGPGLPLGFNVESPLHPEELIGFWRNNCLGGRTTFSRSSSAERYSEEMQGGWLGDEEGGENVDSVYHLQSTEDAAMEVLPEQPWPPQQVQQYPQQFGCPPQPSYPQGCYVECQPQQTLQAQQYAQTQGHLQQYPHQFQSQPFPPQQQPLQWSSQLQPLSQQYEGFHQPIGLQEQRDPRYMSQTPFSGSSDGSWEDEGEVHGHLPGVSGVSAPPPAQLDQNPPAANHFIPSNVPEIACARAFHVHRMVYDALIMIPLPDLRGTVYESMPECEVACCGSACNHRTKQEAARKRLQGQDNIQLEIVFCRGSDGLMIHSCPKCAERKYKKNPKGLVLLRFPMEPWTEAHQQENKITVNCTLTYNHENGKWYTKSGHEVECLRAYPTFYCAPTHWYGAATAESTFRLYFKVSVRNVSFEYQTTPFLLDTHNTASQCPASGSSTTSGSISSPARNTRTTSSRFSEDGHW